MGIVKPCKKVRSEAPYFWGWFLKHPKAAQIFKTNPQTAGQTAFRYPAFTGQSPLPMDELLWSHIKMIVHGIDVDGGSDEQKASTLLALSVFPHATRRAREKSHSARGASDCTLLKDPLASNRWPVDSVFSLGLASSGGPPCKVFAVSASS